MNGYELSSNWFEWAFENPEKIRPIHSAIYFFAIEQCNKFGWKEKFGFPSQLAMEAVGVKKWHTYNGALMDLVEWGFINIVEKSKNQYTASIISISSAMPKNGKALGKARSKQEAKQGRSIGQSTGQSTDDINKLYKEEPTNEETKNNKWQIEICPFFGDNDFQGAWKDWVDVRNKKKASSTKRAITRALNRLMELSKGIKEDAIKIVEKSADKGWSDLYEIEIKEKPGLMATIKW